MTTISQTIHYEARGDYPNAALSYVTDNDPLGIVRLGMGISVVSRSSHDLRLLAAACMEAADSLLLAQGRPVEVTE